MSKQSFTDSYRPAALEFQTSTETASSSSTFTLPYTPVISNDGHTVYAQPQQAYPNAQIQPQVNGTGKKRKLPGVFDEEIAAGAADRVATCLASDHLAVSFPDVDTPFADAADVVRRLLPYHVFQHPADDLKIVIKDPSGKGKAKATGEDLLRQEIAETKFALECFKRRKALEDRFRKAKAKSAERECPDGQAYIIAQAVLEADRAENASMNAQLRAARTELDKVQREKRLAATPQRPTVYTPTSYPYTPQYRHYTYPYAQYQPGYHQVYSSYPTPANSQPMTPMAQFQPSVTPANAEQTLLSKAIPVQLPVSSLPALHALGIMPVSSTSLPPPDQPQPQAVLKGTTSNGTMLSLEINLNLLQTTQTSGLAMILNSLTSAATSGTSTTGR